MATFSYKSGNAQLDELRELLDDTQHGRFVFPDEVLKTFLSKGKDLYQIAADAYIWLSTNTEALKKKFGLPSAVTPNDLLNMQQRAFDIAEQFRNQSSVELTFIEEEFDSGAHLRKKAQEKTL